MGWAARAGLHVKLLRRDIYASHRFETYSEMLSRPPVLLDAVGRIRAAIASLLSPSALFSLRASLRKLSDVDHIASQPIKL